MNFKTTAILLVVVLVVGLLVLLVPQGGQQTQETAPAKLLTISPSDVTRVAFTSDDGNIVLEKSQGHWNLTSPVKGPAEDATVSTLLDTITGLQTRGQVKADASNGFDQARKLELTTADNKSIKLDIGSKSGAGDNLYVRRDGQSQADVVPAALYDQLQKPLKQWRRERLFDVAATGIQQMHIATTQQSVDLEKKGEDWQVATGPTTMPADNSAALDLTMAVNNLRAVEFVSEKDADAPRYGLDQPVMTVSFSTQPPATQPSTSQPAMTTVKFGRYDDVLKKNVYASTSDAPGVVTVAASSLDAFRKKPLDLRDRKVLSIDADKVTKITILAEKPAATQPATPVVLERAKVVMGPVLPTTTPSTTQATSQPATPPSKWHIASKDGAEAEDSKIDQLLGDLHPLRAEKYMEVSSATQPAATYTLKIETTDATYELQLTDPGNSLPLIGAYNGLLFECSRFLADRLTTDYSKGSAPLANPMQPSPSPSFPMMPGQ